VSCLHTKSLNKHLPRTNTTQHECSVSQRSSEAGCGSGRQDCVCQWHIYIQHVRDDTNKMVDTPSTSGHPPEDGIHNPPIGKPTHLSWELVSLVSQPWHGQQVHSLKNARACPRRVDSTQADSESCIKSWHCYKFLTQT
jgi:hypothetical protein